MISRRLSAGVAAAALLVSVGAAQDSKGAQAPPSIAASRGFEPSRTLVVLEFPARRDLLALREELPLLEILLHEKTQGFLQFLRASHPGWDRFCAKQGEVFELLDRFDEGLAAGIVLSDGAHENPRPEIYLLGSASEASRLRELDVRFPQLLRSMRAEDERGGISIKKSAVADSPLTVVRAESMAGNKNWRFRRHASFVRRGRVAAMHAGSDSLGPSSFQPRIAKVDAGIEAVFASLLSGRARHAALHPDFEDVAARERASERGTSLVRAVLRSGLQTAAAKGEERATLQRIDRAMGYDGWRGAALRIERGGDGLREVLELSTEGLRGRSPWLCMREDESGLVDVARHLPAHALAAARLRFDGAAITAWLQDFSSPEMLADTAPAIRAFFERVRSVLGLEGGADAGLRGLDELVVAFVPPAAGALLPELCVLVEHADAAAQAPRAIERFAEMFARGEPVRTRRMGKGEDVVHYLAMRDVFGDSQMGSFSMASKLALGGGYLSATQVGPYLALGFNPRTLRKLRRGVAKGETLATRAGFAELYAEKGRFFEAWVDWPELVRSADPVAQLLPLLASFMDATVPLAPGEVARETSERRPFVVPTPADLAPFLGVQRVLGTRTSDRLRLVSDGSLVFSPSLINIFSLLSSAGDKVFRLLDS